MKSARGWRSGARLSESGSRLASRRPEPSGIAAAPQTARDRRSPLRTIWAMTAAMAREPRSHRTYIPGIAGEGRTEVRYRGGSRDGWRDAYHYLLTMPLAAFLAVMAGV